MVTVFTRLCNHGHSLLGDKSNTSWNLQYRRINFCWTVHIYICYANAVFRAKRNLIFFFLPCRSTSTVEVFIKITRTYGKETKVNYYAEVSSGLSLHKIGSGCVYVADWLMYARIQFGQLSQNNRIVSSWLLLVSCKFLKKLHMTDHQGGVFNFFLSVWRIRKKKNIIYSRNRVWWGNSFIKFVPHHRRVFMNIFRKKTKKTNFLKHFNIFNIS